MATFAHIENGLVHDPQDNATAGEYLARYTADVTASWGSVVQVPEGTEHNAAANDNGTFTNPVEPVIPPAPRKLTKLEFIGLVQTAGGMTDEQLVTAHDDANLRPLWIKFDHAPENIDKTHPLVLPGLGALAALGYIPNGAQSVLDGWPVA